MLHVSNACEGMTKDRRELFGRHGRRSGGLGQIKADEIQQVAANQSTGAQPQHPSSPPRRAFGLRLGPCSSCSHLRELASGRQQSCGRPSTACAGGGVFSQRRPATAPVFSFETKRVPTPGPRAPLCPQASAPRRAPPCRGHPASGAPWDTSPGRTARGRRSPALPRALALSGRREARPWVSSDREGHWTQAHLP